VGRSLLVIISIKVIVVKHLWKKIPDYLKNRYAVSVLVFIVWMVFFDQNNIISQYRLTRKVNDLSREKAFYQEEIQKDHSAASELKTNLETLEKFARENYLMKRENEDIFLIVNEED